MPAEVVTEAEQMPRRARYLVPRGLPRRGEILAACVVLAVLVHVLFAQLTIDPRRRVLPDHQADQMAPVVADGPGRGRGGVDAAVGPRAAAAGFADGPAQVARYLGASGQQVSHLLHFTAAFAGISTLAAAAASARHPRGRRRGGRHRLAELAAHRRVERAAGPPRPAGGRPARRHQAGDPGRGRRDQGRQMPRGGGRVRRAGSRCPGRKRPAGWRCAARPSRTC